MLSILHCPVSLQNDEHAIFLLYFNTVWLLNLYFLDSFFFLNSITGTILQNKVR